MIIYGQLIFKKGLRLFNRERMISLINGTGLTGGSVDKNPPANEEDRGSIPNPGRSHMLWSN